LKCPKKGIVRLNCEIEFVEVTEKGDWRDWDIAHTVGERGLIDDRAGCDRNPV